MAELEATRTAAITTASANFNRLQQARTCLHTQAYSHLHPHPHPHPHLSHIPLLGAAQAGDQLDAARRAASVAVRERNAARVDAQQQQQQLQQVRCRATPTHTPTPTPTPTLTSRASCVLAGCGSARGGMRRHRCR